MLMSKTSMRTSQWIASTTKVMSISFLLLIVALVLFIIAAIPGVNSKVNLVALGLACWVLADILGGAHIHA